MTCHELLAAAGVTDPNSVSGISLAVSPAGGAAFTVGRSGSRPDEVVPLAPDRARQIAEAWAGRGFGNS